jgi:hypothetical protein
MMFKQTSDELQKNAKEYRQVKEAHAEEFGP